MCTVCLGTSQEGRETGVEQVHGGWGVGWGGEMGLGRSCPALEAIIRALASTLCAKSLRAVGDASVGNHESHHIRPLQVERRGMFQRRGGFQVTA